jgi:hyaluronan synthase
VESFHRPSIYLKQSPILFFGALRRELAAFVMPVTVVLYVTSGFLLFRAFSWWDYLHRPIITLIYLSLRNPYRPTIKEWLWSIPANVFYNIPLPAILMWSLITVTHDAWGTTMRSSKELMSQSSKLRAKIWELGFFVLWMGILGGALGRYIAGLLMLNPLQTAGSIFVGAVPVWAMFTWWMVVVE